MGRGEDAARALEEVACGRLTPAMGVARLLVATRDLGAARSALARAPSPLAGAAAEVAAVLDAHEAGAGRVLALLEADATAAPGGGFEACRRFFDSAAAGSAPDAACAIAALGDPDLLAAATAEIAALAVASGLTGPGRRLLDLGCGSGRLAAALAGDVAELVGVDLSPGMVARARERCSGLANVRFEVVEGGDLAGFADAAFDAVLAVDVLPYLYRAGGPGAAAAMLDEAARVLRPGGRLLALNLSYRGGDANLDREDASAFAARAGLAVLRLGERDLASWDGLTFLLAKPGG